MVQIMKKDGKSVYVAEKNMNGKSMALKEALTYDNDLKMHNHRIGALKKTLNK